jgi:hypothetical protein
LCALGPCNISRRAQYCRDRSAAASCSTVTEREASVGVERLLSGTAASSTRSSGSNAPAFLSARLFDALHPCCSIAHIQHRLSLHLPPWHSRPPRKATSSTSSRGSVQVQSTPCKTLPRHSTWRQGQRDPCGRFGPGSVLSPDASTAAGLPCWSWSWCSRAPLSLLLLIRRSLVRAQVGEPKTSRTTTTCVNC